ncbi:hypothetical protein FD755_012530, partial [Muntiacus reevesi]
KYPPEVIINFHDWAGLDEDEDAHVWEDNWDDDNVEDDFSNQLSCVRLCDLMECSTPGLPVHHQLPQFTQTWVH